MSKETTRAKVAQAKQRPCVSVVDDDDGVLHSLVLYLSMKGFEVTAYGNGKELLGSHALDLCRLFILDINMPEMDGFALLQNIRSLGISAPVVLMSGLGDQQIEARAQASGAAAFVNKPLDPKALLNIVTQLIGN